MLDQKTNVAELARRLKVSRNAVSMAVHHGVFSGVYDQVRKALGL